MTRPIIRLSDLTDHGHVVLGPGAATVLVEGRCISVVGDVCVGADRTGRIVTGCPRVLAMGRPVARAASFVGPCDGGFETSAVLLSPTTASVCVP